MEQVAEHSDRPSCAVPAMRPLRSCPRATSAVRGIVERVRSSREPRWGWTGAASGAMSFTVPAAQTHSERSAASR